MIAAANRPVLRAPLGVALLQTLLVCAAMFLALALPANAQSTERVRFEPGRTGTQVSGELSAYEEKDYLVNVAAGQFMTVDLIPSNANVTFEILDPRGRSIDDGTNGRHAEIRLNRGGDWTIRVSYAAFLNIRQPFKLDITVVSDRPAPGGDNGGDTGGDTGSEAEPNWWMVTGVPSDQGLNFRAGPSLDDRILDRLQNGTVVRNIGCRTIGAIRWCNVRLQRGTEGWLSARYLVASRKPVVPTPDPDPPAPEPGPKGDWLKVQNVPSGQVLNLRASASINAQIRGTLSNGDVVASLGCSSGWCRLRTETGTTGYASARYLVESEPPLPEVEEPAPAPDPGGTWLQVSGVPGGGWLNVRTGPSLSNDIIAKLNEGDVVRNLGCRDSAGQRWCNLRLTNGTNGWSAGRYLREAAAPGGGGTGDGREPDWWQVTGVPSGEYLNLRSGPSTSDSIIGRLSNGDRLKNGGCRVVSGGRWCDVTTTGNTRGWVSARYLRESSAPAPTAPPPTGDPDWWRVKDVPEGQVLNVRAGPSIYFRVVDRVSNGDRLRHVGCDTYDGQRWCEVVTPASEQGWVSARYLGTGAAPGPVPTPPPATGTGPDYWEVFGLARGETLNLRIGPSTTDSVVARLANGTRLRNRGCRDANGAQWCAVEMTDGVTGWVAKQYLREPAF